MWYAGDDNDLPPQIESRLHDYLDNSHAQLVGIIPLHRPVPEKDPTTEGPPQSQPETGPLLGALIIEQLTEQSELERLVARSASVLEHAQTALANASDYQSILFAPLWQRLGQLSVVTRTRQLPKSLLALIAIVLMFTSLFFIPYPFTLGASGQLTPQSTHEVFARIDGTLQEILVPDETDIVVERNQLLARMTNSELQAEIQELSGRLKQTEEQIRKLERAQNSNLNQTDSLMIGGELEETFDAKISLQRQLEIKSEQASYLEVRAPAAGQVINWKVRENLIRRPVQRGQNLMTIIDPDTEWLVELELPERRTIHLLQAWNNRDEEERLPVTFTLASHPGREFTGTVQKIDRQLQVHSDKGNSLRVMVAFDEQAVPAELLRNGTRVTAKIRVGRRTIGYVWFHELFETVQASVLFWL